MRKWLDAPTKPISVSRKSIMTFLLLSLSPEKFQRQLDIAALPVSLLSKLGSEITSALAEQTPWNKFDGLCADHDIKPRRSEMNLTGS